MTIDLKAARKYYTNYANEHGHQPTTAEVAEAFGVAWQTAAKLPLRLEETGFTIPGDPLPRSTAEERAQRDRKALRFLVDYQAENGWAPSVREVQEALGLSSVQTAHRSLRNLERDGLIERGDDPRQIRIVGAKLVVPEEVLK